MRNRNYQDEEVLFANVIEAQEVIAQGNQKLEKAGQAKMIAWIGSGVSLLTYFLFGASVILGIISWIIAFGCAVTAYVLAGGVGKAFKAVWKVAKFGWFVIPYFPMDLFIGALAAGMAAYFFICVPIVIVLISLKQTKRDVMHAYEYLQKCNVYGTI